MLCWELSQNGSSTAFSGFVNIFHIFCEFVFREISEMMEVSKLTVLAMKRLAGNLLIALKHE